MKAYQFVYRNKRGERIEALVSARNKEAAENRLKREAKGVNKVDIVTSSEVAEWYMKEYGKPKRAEVISIA